MAGYLAEVKLKPAAGSFLYLALCSFFHRQFTPPRSARPGITGYFLRRSIQVCTFEGGNRSSPRGSEATQLRRLRTNRWVTLKRVRDLLDRQARNGPVKSP